MGESPLPRTALFLVQNERNSHLLRAFDPAGLRTGRTLKKRRTLTVNEPTLELIVRAKDGDASAWLAIDERYRESLMRIVRGKFDGDMRRRLDTEDLVQSALVAAFEGLPGFEYQGEGSLQAWLVQILRNRRRQRLRHHLSVKRDVRLDASDDALESWVDLTSMEPGQAILAAESQANLMDAIDELPELDRIIVVANFVDEIPIAEIAKQIGRHPSNVRRHLASALLAIQKKLD